ncbi:MAG: hypothetical protein QXT25_03240 [Candidatus Anstonellaceae archaeon]
MENQTINVPAYRFESKEAAIEALNAVNQQHGFSFNISGYGEDYIVERRGRYYIPKDEYTSVLEGQAPLTYYRVTVELPSD